MACIILLLPVLLVCAGGLRALCCTLDRERPPGPGPPGMRGLCACIHGLVTCAEPPSTHDVVTKALCPQHLHTLVSTDAPPSPASTRWAGVYIIKQFPPCNLHEPLVEIELDPPRMSSRTRTCGAAGGRHTAEGGGVEGWRKLHDDECNSLFNMLPCNGGEAYGHAMDDCGYLFLARMPSPPHDPRRQQAYTRWRLSGT
ncbi:uncharacterized protein BXZ73DRAFT_80882 [Epithele typhae]|uniref:uncharacterized protein n=1 Tax=Epithele typhae TaxID=378194 RepID=UPI002007D08F|nr:uncharacterized protein BXZ73DRAFT_80882 [Epithele typhae]KAH9917122.1 hypothetical protein BXZ73DRAFT_80882 [Epithele typhae]